MRAVVTWCLHCLEGLLLGLGIGCLGAYAYELHAARQFQAAQVAAFERASDSPSMLETGAMVGMLDVPRLELSTPVIQGDDGRTLQRAVGHLPDTPLPWEPGNSAIAGHRDGLFRPLKDVKVGDEIRFRTPREEIRYRVSRTAIVMPDDVSVLAPGQSALTLITCYPFHYVGTAPKRFIVHAERLGSAPPGE
jgi:sortase A